MFKTITRNSLHQRALGKARSANTEAQGKTLPEGGPYCHTELNWMEPAKTAMGTIHLEKTIFARGSLRQTLDLSKTTNEKVPGRRPPINSRETLILII